jgi:hypothetical protein
VQRRAPRENGAMKNPMQRFLAWLERSAQLRGEREIESYLAQAADAADLENRLRQLERRK